MKIECSCGCLTVTQSKALADASPSQDEVLSTFQQDCYFYSRTPIYIRLKLVFVSELFITGKLIHTWQRL